MSETRKRALITGVTSVGPVGLETLQASPDLGRMPADAEFHLSNI